MEVKTVSNKTVSTENSSAPLESNKSFLQLEVNKEKYAILYKNNDLSNVYDDLTIIGLPYIS